MKLYVKVTGTIFFLITLAHFWRVYIEGLYVARDPWFLSMTLLAIGLCIWAWNLSRA